MRCDCTFADDGSASWYSVCHVPMVEWWLDCENSSLDGRRPPWYRPQVSVGRFLWVAQSCNVGGTLFWRRVGKRGGVGEREGGRRGAHFRIISVELGVHSAQNSQHRTWCTCDVSVSSGLSSVLSQLSTLLFALSLPAHSSAFFCFLLCVLSYPHGQGCTTPTVLQLMTKISKSVVVLKEPTVCLTFCSLRWLFEAFCLFAQRPYTLVVLWHVL